MDEDPLQAWSRIANENTKHAAVSAAYVGMLSRSPQIDSFSTWLLAGTGATASLLVANIADITAALSVPGFKICLSLLAIAALFGLFTKCASVFLPIDGERQAALQQQMLDIFTTHGETREKIEESAQLRNLPPPPDIDLGDIITELLRPMPFWARWLTQLYLKKHKDNRQIGYLLPLRAFIWQVNLCTLQALFFVAFVVATILHA